jgi:hypothetical protein
MRWKECSYKPTTEKTATNRDLAFFFFFFFLLYFFGGKTTVEKLSFVKFSLVLRKVNETLNKLGLIYAVRSVFSLVW